MFREEDRLTTEEVIALRRAECAASDNTTDVLLHCPREFDGWSCINATPAGSVAHFPCPYFVFGFDPRRSGHRSCLEDGTWFRHPESNKTWSNYTTCIDLDDLLMRTQVNLIYKTGYTVSLAALVFSLFIFFYFKSLTCTRIQIHKNLFISLAVNNLLWLVWYEAVVDNIPVLIYNGLGCQVLHILVQYFMTATYLWMFCEGLYLHTLLVVTFITESKVMPLLYLVGWGGPAILVFIYASLRASTPEDTFHCWMDESSYSWTISVPVCISMVTNFFFLINIVRLLLTKLHAAQQTTPSSSFKDKNASVRSKRSTMSGGAAALSKRTRKAVRATLILIPLLGLQFIVAPFRPAPGTPWEYAYQFTLAVVASCQGLCVSLLFCFCNGEVRERDMSGSRLLRSLVLQGRGALQPSASLRQSSSHSAALEPSKIGAREVVGFGYNGEPAYLDKVDFPFPSVRFRPTTADIKLLREKEKGDWKNLSIAEKKALYRASFCQTFAEINAPTGEWKSITGWTLVVCSLAFWAYLGLKLFVYPSELPPSFKEENRREQLKRMLAWRMNPIEGISSRYDYEKGEWKK